MSAWRGKTVEKAAGTGGRPTSELPTDGMHGAVIVGIIDLGTHPSQYESEGGEVRDYDKHRMLMAVELTGCPLPDGSGNNWVFAKELTLSFRVDSNLAKLATAVLKAGKDTEWGPADLLGKPCSAEIKHSEGKMANKWYANLASVKGRIEGLPVKQNKREPYIWTFESEDELAMPAWIPGWLYGERVLDIIHASIEWKAAHGTSQAEKQKRQTTAPADVAPWDDGAPSAPKDEFADDPPF